MNIKSIKTEITILELESMSWMPVDGKKAIIKGWQLKDNVESNLKFKKGHNIAIRTGKVSGCLVVDVDVKNRGLEIWTELERKMGRIDTYRVITGTGGLHL